MKTRRVFAIFLTACLFFSGCSGGETRSGGLPEGAEPYRIPEFQNAVFHENQAKGTDRIRIDLSCTEQGYIALQARDDKPLKFQMENGDMKYNYNIPGDGTTVVLPTNMGDGIYTLRLLENAGGNKYSCPWIDSCQVTLKDEFAPFLRPSQMVNYSEDSDCVALAKELAARCEKDSDVVAAIYDYLVRHISYDKAKAAAVESGYLPDPDSTLVQRKGICFDYASLAAAMMRSLGIPCKLIMGYVDGTLYHAWNCFYLQEQGWVTVEIKAKPGLWQRVDITMAASGTKTADLEDDSKYTTRYTY